MRRFKRLLQIGEWFCAAMVPIIGASRYVNLEKWEEPFRAHLGLLIDWSFPLIMGLAVGGFGFKAAGALLEGVISNRDEIKRILDAFQKNYFQNVPEDHYKNRVTLFKACKGYRLESYRPKRSRYLKIFVRAGTAYQKSKIWFPIDDEREEGNEGVAGRAWFENGHITVTDLPDWQDTSAPERNRNCKEYAAKGFVSIPTAQRLDIKSRSISATIVRTPSGQRWGVLVLDSRDPQGISMEPEKKAMVTLIADVLTSQV